MKFESDREALRRAVLTKGQKKFFAGTDSAPHTKKLTECGCAAGCYTGGCAPQLYAMAFEGAGADLETEQDQELFIRFLSLNGTAFYDFEASSEAFTLAKRPSHMETRVTTEGAVVPLPNGLDFEMTWSLES